MATQRTDAGLIEWLNSPEYGRRVAILDDLAAEGRLPPVETVALMLDIPRDLATGLVRLCLDPAGFERFTRRTIQ